jgi:hypothetical protein
MGRVAPCLLVLASVAAVLIAACGSDEIWACQNSTTTGGFTNAGVRTDCEVAWLCDADNGGALVLDLKCTNTGGSTFKCDCIGNGNAKGSFTSADICESATLAEQVNEGCNWKVPEEADQVAVE